jgi:hypothetical protein
MTISAAVVYATKLRDAIFICAHIMYRTQKKTMGSQCQRQHDLRSAGARLPALGQIHGDNRGDAVAGQLVAGQTKLERDGVWRAAAANFVDDQSLLAHCKGRRHRYTHSHLPEYGLSGAVQSDGYAACTLAQERQICDEITIGSRVKHDSLCAWSAHVIRAYFNHRVILPRATCHVSATNARALGKIRARGLSCDAPFMHRCCKSCMKKVELFGLSVSVCFHVKRH